MTLRNDKRKGASVFDTVKRRLGVGKKPMRVDSKQFKDAVRDAEELAVAVKSKDRDALKRYLKRFDNGQIEVLCKVLKLPCGVSREENMRELVRKIKSKERNFVRASLIGIGYCMSLIYAILAVGSTVTGVHAGYSMRYKPNDVESRGQSTNLVFASLFAPWFAYFASGSYSDVKALQKHNKLWQTKKKHEQMDKLHETIKTFKR